MQPLYIIILIYGRIVNVEFHLKVNIGWTTCGNFAKGENVETVIPYTKGKKERATHLGNMGAR